MSIDYDRRRRSTEKAASIHELLKKTVLASQNVRNDLDRRYSLTLLVGRVSKTEKYGTGIAMTYQNGAGHFAEILKKYGS